MLAPLGRELLDLVGRHRRGMHDRGVQAGGEFLDLRRPVGQQRGRRHQQARRPGVARFLHQQQRQHLDGLAEPHVVGQAGAQAEARQQMQPARAGTLVGPQRALAAPARDRRRRRPRRAAPSGFRSSHGPAVTRDQSASAAAGSSPVTAAPASIRIASAKLRPSRAASASASRNRSMVLLEPGAIDFHPLAAQQHQVLGAGQQGGDLVLGQGFAVER